MSDAAIQSMVVNTIVKELLRADALAIMRLFEADQTSVKNEAYISVDKDRSVGILE